MACEGKLNLFLPMLELCIEAGRTEAGCDEAGRGCLAGPVFAAAVILPSDFHCSDLNDSKKLSESKRNELRKIIEREAISFAVGQYSPAEIDEVNILWASFLAMHRALDLLSMVPDHIAVDGNRFKPYKDISHSTIVKGDGKYLHIAAASILAKTYRDEHMKKLHEDFPEFGWEQNKGYPTKIHREAIRQFGPTVHHRKTFQLLPQQLPLL